MGDNPPPDGASTPSSDALAAPVRARVIEYLLSAEDEAVGMARVVNEVARFIAGRDAASVEEFALETVRRDLEVEHAPALVRAGLVTFDREADVLALAVSRPAARRALERRVSSDEPVG